MARRIHSFLGLLSLQLAATDDSTSLRDALEAAVFFASSMGRLGADFAPQLESLFANRMHVIVARHWTDGAQQLSETLRVCREAGVASPLMSSHGSGTDDARDGLGDDPAGVAAPLDGPQPPPRQLLALPQLARFVNSILTGLNELRRCLLPNIFARLRSSMDEVLQSVKADLISNERAVLTPGLRGEAATLRETAARMRTVFADIVEPYARGSLEAALGSREGAERYHTILRENEKESPPEVVEEEEVAEENEQEKEHDAAGDASNREGLGAKETQERSELDSHTADLSASESNL